jgi:hypothetical protein
MKWWHRFVPTRAKDVVGLLRRFERGVAFAQMLPRPTNGAVSGHEPPNPLRDYFTAHKDGPGIWKWMHYFDIYQRHLERFRGRAVHVLEIGVFSGGSLGMWRAYFGGNATVYGIDIEPVCRAYEAEGIRIFIGDQGDRTFWRGVINELPHLDVVIDDGSHIAEHQITSFEELFPFIAPGGVYICEDVHGTRNRFSSFIYGIADSLNACALVLDQSNPARSAATSTTAAQAAITGISLYPFITVIEKREDAPTNFIAPKHGTQWQPFGERWNSSTGAQHQAPM